MSGRIIKIVSISSFIALTTAILIARSAPADGYEISIYTATPFVVWVVLLAGMLSGIGIILYWFTGGAEADSYQWKTGLLLLSFSFITLLSIHIFRGYAFYGKADSVTHLAFVRNVILNGQTFRENIYPVTHIYIAQLSLVSGISPERLFSLLPVFFNMLYILLVYLFSQALLSRSGSIVLATTAGVLLLSGISVGSVYADPNSLANLIWPLAVLLYVRESSADEPLRLQITFLLVIMLFLLPPFHVISAFALLIVVGTFWAPPWLYGLSGRIKRTVIDYRFVAPAFFILLVWSFSWIRSFYVWEAMLRAMRTALVEGGDAGWAGHLSSQMAMAGQFGYSVIEYVLKAFYAGAVYGLVAMAAFLILLFILPSNPDFRKLFSLYGPMLMVLVATAVLYLLPIRFSPLRMLSYALLLCVPLMGFFFSQVRSALNKGMAVRAGYALLIIFFILVAVNGLLIAYPSPYRLIANDQPVDSEPKSFTWLNDHRNPELGLAVLTLPVDRMATLLPEADEMREDVSLIPYHFNYDKSARLGESYSRDRYMIINELDRVMYIELFPEIAPFRFYPHDFTNLENDWTVARVYTNRDVDVWYIYALKAEL